MMLIDYASKVATLDTAGRRRFLETLAHNLTVSARAVWDDEQLSDAEKVEQLKWLNEIQHRILGNLRAPKLWPDNEFFEGVLQNYVGVCPPLSGTVTWAVKKGFEYASAAGSLHPAMTPEIQGMAPLLQVFDMPTSLAFYRDVLGFEVAESSEPGDNCDWVLLRLRDVDLMLNTAYEAHARPASADPSRVAYHEDTSLFFSCPDVEAAYTYLHEKGVPVEKPVVAPYGMKQLWLKDPDGYVICFQWPAA